MFKGLEQFRGRQASCSLLQVGKLQAKSVRIVRH